MAELPFEDVRIEMAELNRTMQNLHEFQDHFEVMANALDLMQSRLDHVETHIHKLVCVQQRTAALFAVDASLRCPWSELSVESLVDLLRRLTTATCAEAFDDIEAP